MLHSVGRLWTVCCLVAAVTIAAGAEGLGTDEKVRAGSKSVQINAAPKTVRMEFLLDKALAAKVISLLEPQFKNVKFTMHPIFNGFYAWGSMQDLLHIKSLVPSLDKAPEAPAKPERSFIEISYGDLNEIKGLIASLVPNMQYTIDEEQHLLTLQGPRADIELIRESLTDDWDEPTQLLIDCQLVDLSPKGVQELGPTWFGEQGFLHRCAANTFTFTDPLMPTGPSGREESTVEASSASQVLGPEIKYFIASETTLGPTLRSLQERNEATPVAHPKIGLIAGKPALIMLGDKFPIVYFAPRGGQFQVQYVELGFQLDVKATLMQDDSIECELATKTLSLLALVNNQYPQTAIRKSNISVRLKQGETIAITGLLSQAERLAGSKIPLLNDLPVLATLFRSGGERSGREVVLTLTPRVMR